MVEGGERVPEQEDNGEQILKEIGSVTLSAARAASVNAFERYFGAHSRGPFLVDERGEKKALWSAGFEKLVKKSKREPLRPGSFRALELQSDATSQQIIEQLGNGYECNLGDIADLLARHATGEQIPFHTGGWANLFFVRGKKPEIVHAFMNQHGRGWCFESFPLSSDLKWMKGVRVFSRINQT